MLIYGTKNFFAIISIFTFHFLFFSFAFLFYYFFLPLLKVALDTIFFLSSMHTVLTVFTEIRFAMEHCAYCLCWATLICSSCSGIPFVVCSSSSTMLYFITVIDVDFCYFAAYLLHSTILFTSFSCRFEATWNQWRKLRVFQRKMIPLLK